MKRSGFLMGALAVAALFFGWRAYVAWTGAVKPSGIAAPVPAAAPIGVTAEEAHPPADLSLSTVSIAARPVFRPDRQPFRESVAGQTGRNYDSELARFMLVGVLMMGQDTKGVVVGKGAAGRDERWEVSPGDTIPGFTVKTVGADGLTLTADGREFLLPLYAGGPKGPVGQGPLRTEVSTGRPSASVPPPGPPSSPSARQAPSSARGTTRTEGIPPTTSSFSSPRPSPSPVAPSTQSNWNTPGVTQIIPSTQPPSTGGIPGDDTTGYSVGRRIRPSPGRR